jgi:hypothetical protein
MTNPMQHHGWLSRTTLRAASAALALAVVLVPAVLATGLAASRIADDYGLMCGKWE